MLNLYLSNLHSLISEYELKKFPQFVGTYGSEATLDDLVWYHIDSKTGRKIRLLCTIFNGQKIRNDSKLSSELALAKPYDHLLKIFIIESLAIGSSAAHLQSKIISARTILSVVKNSLDDVTIEGWNSSKDSGFFWQFCKRHNLLGGHESPIYCNDDRDRTGDEINERRRNLLPSQPVIEALGQIFINTFRDVDDEGKVIPDGSIDISDALTCTFAALSLASPNRTGAEIPVIHKQKLKSYSETYEKPVYYLEWKGSKGYKNYKNHILEALSSNVSQAINFFYSYCEPYRVIARFYENPNQKCKDLLCNFSVNKELLSNDDLNNIPSLFFLAFVLGFYNHNATVLVIKNINRSKLVREKGGKLNSTHFSDKLIRELNAEDFFYTPGFHKSKVWSILFGVIVSPDTVKELEDFITVKELQDYWIGYYKSQLSTSFPYAYSAGENYEFYSELLFCLPRCVLNRSSLGGVKYSKSFLALDSPRNISYHVSSRLNKSNVKRSARFSIFQENGYGEVMYIRPHQLRHFANTLADLSNIPVEINTAWSGRKDVSQTFEYIHTTKHEESERLSSVLDFSNDKDSDIRIITSKDLDEITNLPASVTSTGVCIQELNVSPCEYLNDFVSQCFMCSSSCHIAGDQKAIDLFEKDFVYQKARLDQVRNDSRVKVSKAMQDWLVLHHRNTEVLQSLILLMKEYPVGSIIRFSQSISEFKVTDLSTKKVETIRFSLPGSNSEMESLQSIETSHVDLGIENSDLNNLLSNFGLSEE
ncbi:hypothetical protein LCGC14_0168200 [marine sediment metagenome]|uniref:Integrase n=2 Tax=root TaxID=1 RepID=A0ABS9S942_9GAMM|nr:MULTISPECIES: hypothetical protein [Halomonas]MCH4812600.1 hypothetical protein [Halomonas neptunia]TDV96855.1 hypothetical protein BDK62_109140 [Halomonas alkaliantarctica]HDZ45955.1 hypothetical protein [Halomonas sp.]HEB04381.1 hypothetical protein [Halomonas sp.]